MGLAGTALRPIDPFLRWIGMATDEVNQDEKGPIEQSLQHSNLTDTVHAFALFMLLDMLSKHSPSYHVLLR
jgi:hypothetical protein